MRQVIVPTESFLNLEDHITKPLLVQEYEALYIEMTKIEPNLGFLVIAVWVLLIRLQVDQSMLMRREAVLEML